MELVFRKGFRIIFRAYNDGVAYRIATGFKDSIIVNTETAHFHFPPGAHAWTPIIHKRENQDVFHASFEELYPYHSLTNLKPDDVMYAPRVGEYDV